MVQEDLLIKVINRINQIDIPYMLTGGIAAIFYGKPRLTHDFDLVVEIGTKKISKLIDSFKDEFFVSAETIQKAIEDRSTFNLIHFDSGIKVDFWLIKEDEFDQKRFERRQKHSYSGREIVFSSPEDIILIKLLWFKDSRIQKHLEDAIGIVEIQGDLDMSYVREWADKLSVQKFLDIILKQEN